jgi:hypothetical protein
MIIVDDIQSKEPALSEEQKKKLIQWWERVNEIKRNKTKEFPVISESKNKTA